MTGIGRCFCVQISQISKSDQSFCGFSVTPTLLPSCHLVFVVFGEILDNVKSVKNQRVIHRSTQCFIDGQENNNGNLALGFEQFVELFN